MNRDFKLVGSSEDPATQQINTDSPHGAKFYRMKGKIPRLKSVCEWNPCMSLDTPISSDAHVLLFLIAHRQRRDDEACQKKYVVVFTRMIDIDRITSDIVMIGSDTRN